MNTTTNNNNFQSLFFSTCSIIHITFTIICKADTFNVKFLDEKSPPYIEIAR